jgi:FkbM family methyltransferase
MRELQFALHTKPDIWISDPIRAGAIFDGHILSLMQQAVAPGDVLADIGANIGWFSVIGSDLVGPEGKVLAFEPEPDNLRLLQRNLSLNKSRNVHVFGTALGSSKRRGTLYRSTDNQGDHQMCVCKTGPIKSRSVSKRLMPSLPAAEIRSISSRSTRRVRKSQFCLGCRMP